MALRNDRVGTINYATNQGLGILAKSFYDAGVVTDFMLVEHSSRPSHREWYPPEILSTKVNPFSRSTARQFLASVGSVLFFETPFDWSLIGYCRKIGTRTILMPMYECMPEPLPLYPDRIINPSLLDQEYYPQGSFIPIPVNTPWRKRERAEVFVHNAGHGGLDGRNGTKELLDAMKYVASPIKLMIRSQAKLPASEGLQDPRVTILKGTFPQEKLWSEGDVFIFPEKFNGLSLPLQEARASGMLVMATDRFPMNTWLPREPLIPVMGYEDKRLLGRFQGFKKAIIDPEDIAKTIDRWYGRDISQYSEEGRHWALGMSWERLKSVYQQAILG